MGMFDEIRIAAPHNEALDPRVRDATFQTKSLDCWMNMYEVSSDGRLIEHVGRRVIEYIDEDYTRDTEYHGDIVFYVLLRDRPTGKAQFNDGTMLEYKARFTDGTLQWIRPIFTSGMSVKGVIPEGESVVTETRYVENDDGTITVRTEIDLGGQKP